jgi:hypothetical protein
MENPVKTYWDANRKAAPYESDEWAVSDRGWLRAAGNTDRMRAEMHDETHCLGHYLDYERKCSSAPDETKTVHAVSCVTKNSSYHATPEEARAWLEAEAKGREFFYVLDQLRSRGAYTHVIDELRTLYTPVCLTHPDASGLVGRGATRAKAETDFLRQWMWANCKSRVDDAWLEIKAGLVESTEA